MFKIDLHTHSAASPDGGLRAVDYQRMLGRGGLDFVAVTDHDSISFAQQLQAELGEKIIVGEEVTAREGEIIGLFLKEVIPAGLSIAETAAKIYEQSGLVYIPHPFETVRKGITAEVLDGIVDQVDIVEVYNGRAIFQNKGQQAKAWAEAHQKSTAASSDAHGCIGWGRTYSMIDKKPTRENLAKLLSQAAYQTGTVGLRGALYPKSNRLQKKLGHG